MTAHQRPVSPGMPPPPLSAGVPLPPARPQGPPPPVRPSRLRRAIAAPPTGWASVLAILVMLGIAGLAMDQPHLAGYGPRGSQTAFLPITMVLGGLVGAVLARLPLPSTLAHLLGAVIGVGALLVAWGLAVSGETTLAGQLRDVNEKAARVFTAVILERGSTQETIGFLIVIGAIAWTTGQFAAYNLVRRGMVAPAIVAVGTVVLIIALSPMTDAGELYPHLVVVTGLALFLILRANLAHQQSSWRRRHIVGGGGVGRAFLRGGAAVAFVALLLASLLGVNVAAAPLSDSLASMDQRFVGEVAQWINALFGGVGSGTDPGNGDFGDTATIRDAWERSDAPLFTVRVDDDGAYYLRGGTYSRFDGTRWTRDPTLAQAIGVPAGEGLLEASDDGTIGSGAGRRRLSFEVTSVGLRSTLLAPAEPVSVSLPTTVILDGQGGPLRRIELRDRLSSGRSYTVDSLVPLKGDEGDGLTQARLAAAGTDYPAWWTRYIDVQPGTLGRGRAVANTVIQKLPLDRRDPFHVALALESWFAGKGSPYKTDKDDFRYATNIANQCKPGEGVVDCLLRTKIGFCQHYATAMTLMLRDRGIPARYVQGYLPGEETGKGEWTVPISAAHAWVEVLFPDLGWVRFDPTPGNLANQSQSDLPVGEPVPQPSAEPSGGPDPSGVPSAEPTVSAEPIPSEPPDGGGMTGSQDPDVPLPLLLLLLLAIVVLVAVILGARQLRRVPGHDAEALYRAIAALATRLGRGPRPAQTAYEFTASLSRAVPGVADDLQAVARAKVESQYGQRDAGDDGFAALLVSFRRVRRALYALFIRRPRG